MRECNFCKYHEEPEWCLHLKGICDFKMVSKKNYKDRLLSEYDVIKAIYENVGRDKALDCISVILEMCKAESRKAGLNDI